MDRRLEDRRSKQNHVLLNLAQRSSEQSKFRRKTIVVLEKRCDRCPPNTQKNGTTYTTPGREDSYCRTCLTKNKNLLR